MPWTVRTGRPDCGLLKASIAEGALEVPSSSLVLHVGSPGRHVPQPRAWLTWWHCQYSNPDLITPLTVSV